MGQAGPATRRRPAHRGTDDYRSGDRCRRVKHLRSRIRGQWTDASQRFDLALRADVHRTLRSPQPDVRRGHEGRSGKRSGGSIRECARAAGSLHHDHRPGRGRERKSDRGSSDRRLYRKGFRRNSSSSLSRLSMCPTCRIESPTTSRGSPRSTREVRTASWGPIHSA